MSQRKRRRRRRGRGGGKSGGGQQQGQQQRAAQTQSGQDQPGGRRRRRRGRGKGPRSPRSSEDLVRALPGERPENLTAPPDGTILEDLIGELQSTWGVPQYPQEYRLLIKVAEQRDRSARPEPQEEDREPRERPDGQLVREKAPPPQQLAGGPTPDSSGPTKPRGGRRRRRRRKRGGGQGSGDDS